jgi:transcriptional regulator NrdR family protein
VRFGLDADLDRENLINAFNIAMRKSKIQLESLADQIMSIHDNANRMQMPRISFNSFYKIIIEMNL